MKTKEANQKKFDTVDMMRKIRDKIDKQTEGMSFEQLKKYYEQSVTENRNRASR